MKVKSLSRVRLSDPMDCSPPGSSVHGIFQARVLEWGAIAFSKYLPGVVYKTQSFLVEEGREGGEMWGQVCLCLLRPSSSVSNRRGIPDTFTCKTSKNPYFTSALATFLSI